MNLMDINTCRQNMHTHHNIKANLKKNKMLTAIKRQSRTGGRVLGLKWTRECSSNCRLDLLESN